MVKNLVFILISTFLSLQNATATEIFTADLYDLSGQEKKFTYEGQREYTVDTMNFKASYKNLDGTLAVEETAQITAGTVVRYEIQRKPTNEVGIIEVKDNKIIFKYHDGQSQKKDKSEPLQPDTLVSANLFVYLQANIEKILAKQDVKFKYAVWYRQETVGFKYSYEKEDGNSVIVRMAPTNMLYRSLVDPIFITVDKTSHKVTHYKGRTTPKIQVDGKFKDFDTSFSYVYAEPKLPAPAIEKAPVKKKK